MLSNKGNNSKSDSSDLLVHVGRLRAEDNVVGLRVYFRVKLSLRHHLYNPLLGSHLLQTCTHSRRKLEPWLALQTQCSSSPTKILGQHLEVDSLVNAAVGFKY